MNKITLVLEERGGGWSGHVKECPGCNSQGESPESCAVMTLEAYCEMIHFRREKAEKKRLAENAALMASPSEIPNN